MRVTRQMKRTRKRYGPDPLVGLRGLIPPGARHPRPHARTKRLRKKWLARYGWSGPIGTGTIGGMPRTNPLLRHDVMQGVTHQGTP